MVCIQKFDYSLQLTNSTLNCLCRFQAQTITKLVLNKDTKKVVLLLSGAAADSISHSAGHHAAPLPAHLIAHKVCDCVAVVAIHITVLAQVVGIH